jgi:hypothetical protein
VLSATLDSNTYISALNFGGTPLEVLNLARAGFIGLDVSDAILDEFAGVLRDKALNELVNNFRRGPPTPMHPSPADDAVLLLKRRSSKQDSGC